MKRIEVLNFYQDWLTKNRSRLEAVGISRIDQAQQALNRQKSSVAARAALVCLPIPRRLPRLWKLWRGGGYQYFHGWKSALRDLIRHA